MKRFLALGGWLFLTASALASGPLFKYDGLMVEEGGLSPAMKQSLFEVQKESYTRQKAIIDNAILERFFEEEAKKAGKSPAEVEAKQLAVSDPSEKEMKAWYEENKARIPYPYDKIKDEVKNFIQQQSKQKKREELLTKVQKQKKIEYFISEPVAPMVAINSDGFPFKGNTSAKVVMVEFADYQCPHCKEASSHLKKIMEKYKDKVKLVYLDFPINRSGVSKVVAEGGFCAWKQSPDKYWQYHYAAFDKQADLKNESPAQLAKDLKLDEAQFTACMNSNEPKDAVAKAKAEGERIGVGGTPSIFVNGRRIDNYSEEGIKKSLDAALKGAST